jgi:iron complex transport system ATP-binding protein
MTATELASSKPGPSTGSGPAGWPPQPALAGTSPAALALELDQVTVSYRPGQRAVKAVSLRVDRGQWLTLIGPNGAGKSSLLKAVVGLVAHTGSVSFGPAGILTARAAGSRERARAVAYVAQQPVLPAGMTVAEYVLLGRTAHLSWLSAERAEDRRLVAEVLDRLDLGGFAARSVTEMSGGEVQRVALARALAQQSAILLLDEPTSALDIGHRMAVLELVDQLRREGGLTVVSAMHDLGAAGGFADQLALLHDGSLVACGSPHEVLTEEILSRYYQTPVQVLTGADGGAVVVPLRSGPGRAAVLPPDHPVDLRREPS